MPSVHIALLEYWLGIPMSTVQPKKGRPLSRHIQEKITMGEMDYHLWPEQLRDCLGVTSRYLVGKAGAEFHYSRPNYKTLKSVFLSKEKIYNANRCYVPLIKICSYRSIHKVSPVLFAFHNKCYDVMSRAAQCRKFSVSKESNSWISVLSSPIVNIKWQKDTQGCWVLLIEPGSNSLAMSLHMSTWGFSDNQCHWQQGEQRRDKVAISIKERRRKAEQRETSLVFLICFMQLLLCCQILWHG